MSELLDLLKKNAYGEDLEVNDFNSAKKLIIEAKKNEGKYCWVCDSIKDNTILDTGICKSHNYYALITRK